MEKTATAAAREQTLDYDEVFLQRYQRIYKWGLQITKQDRELTEDLVHEVYMHFSAVNTHFTDINCFDNYLYIVLRNSYYSYLRRTAHQRKYSTSIEEDLTEDYSKINPLEQIQVCESLYAACQYACIRKETSISACIFLLRFFHGYFPSEIARILKSSRNLVEVALLTARREAAVYLADADASVVPPKKTDFQRLIKKDFKNLQSVAENFRQMMYSAREGECFDAETLKKHYEPGKTGLVRSVLAHLVSCPRCLNTVNQMLELPSLAERHPFDTIGRENIRRKSRSSEENKVVIQQT